jgi:hypothetical protein
VARRVLVSAFLVVHISATVLFAMPACPLRVRCYGVIRYYILPMGLWDAWTMFAPNPIMEVFTLEAELIDARGLRYNFAFPRQADYSVWRAAPRFRHSKFAVNISDPDPEVSPLRLHAARHVARQLALPAEAFPADVHLLIRAQAMPPPGTVPSGPAQKRTLPLGTFHFAKLSEVRP